MRIHQQRSAGIWQSHAGNAGNSQPRLKRDARVRSGVSEDTCADMTGSLAVTAGVVSEVPAPGFIQVRGCSHAREHQNEEFTRPCSRGAPDVEEVFQGGPASFPELLWRAANMTPIHLELQNERVHVDLTV